MAEVLGDPWQAPGDRGGSPAWGLGFHKDSVCLHLPHYPDFPSIACCSDPDTSPCAGHDRGPTAQWHPQPHPSNPRVRGRDFPTAPNTIPLLPRPCPPFWGPQALRTTGHGQSTWGDLWGWASPQHPGKHRSAGDRWGTPCLLLVTGPGLLIEGRSHCPSPQVMRRAT